MISLRERVSRSGSLITTPCLRAQHAATICSINIRCFRTIHAQIQLYFFFEMGAKKFYSNQLIKNERIVRLIYAIQTPSQ
jgi:hypothetical protein